MANQSHIFLSYSRLDGEFALQFAADLKNTGVQLWMDRFEIRPGDAWEMSIQAALNAHICAGMITCVSPAFVESKYCNKELSRANRLGIPVFPVLVRQVAENTWPFELEGLHYIDFTDWQDEQTYIQRLKVLLGSLTKNSPRQFGAKPDPETIYLTDLKARLESEQGVLEYVELSGGAAISESAAIRPSPHKVMASGLSVLLESSPETQLSGSGENTQVDRKLTLSDISELVAEYPRCVLIGDSGSGKTITLYRMVLDAVNKWLDYPRMAPLPFLVSLPEWQSEQTAEEFVLNCWRNCNLPETDLIGLLENGDIALYLDGLNEMGAGGLEKVKLLKDWLYSEYAPEKVVITCRTLNYQGALKFSFPTVLIEPMNDQQVHAFARKYLGQRADGFVKNLFITGQNAEDDKRKLLDLARNPYLLAALILVYDTSKDNSLPRNNGALLQKLVMALWEREKNKGTQGWIPLNQAEKNFARLAFTMIDQEMPTEIPVSDALQHLNYRKTLLFVGRSANLIDMRGQYIRFYHQLILEYFAAIPFQSVNIGVRIKPPHLYALGERKSVKWDPVIIAACGIVPNVNAIIEDIAAIDLFLAIDCIVSTRDVSEELWRQLIRRLIENLHNPNRPVRLASADALVKIGRKAIAPLIETLRTSDIGVRVITSEVLGRMNDRSAVPTLATLVNDRDTRVALAALKSLALIGDERATPALIKTLHYNDPTIQLATIKALGQIRSATAVDQLMRMLRDRNIDIKMAAIKSLGNIGDKRATNELARLLNDQNQIVRLSAVEALGSMGKSAVPVLIRTLDNHDGDMRISAAEALGDLGAKEAVPILSMALSDTNDAVRYAAAAALGKIGDPAAAKELLKMLEDVQFREPAAAALRQLGDSAFTGLIATLNAENSIVRATAIETLGLIQAKSAVPALIERLKDQDGVYPFSRDKICDYAARALEQIGTPEAMRALKNWRRTP